MSEKQPPLLTSKERRSHPKKFECIAVIQKHLSLVGSRNWKDVMDQFPEIPQVTIWRWIAAAKKENPPSPELTRATKKIKNATQGVLIARHEEARAAGTEHIARHLPAAPSPAYIAKSGDHGIANLDFAAQIQVLYADAELLRTYSVTKVDGEPDRIKNPLTFDKSIQRRASILEVAIRTLQELWDLRAMQDFYETVIAEIGAESPDCQQRIMDRLSALNRRSGMTMSMRI